MVTEPGPKKWGNLFCNNYIFYDRLGWLMMDTSENGRSIIHIFIRELSLDIVFDTSFSTTALDTVKLCKEVKTHLHGVL